MTSELYNLTALELSNAYRAKELSPLEVTRAVLARRVEAVVAKGTIIRTLVV